MMASGTFNCPSNDVASNKGSFSQNFHTKKVVKNALGSRLDLAWKYGICIDGDPRKIQCKFCQKTITGGVYGLKHHLVETQKDVVACKSVTDEVKNRRNVQIWCGLAAKINEKNRLILMMLL